MSCSSATLRHALARVVAIRLRSASTPRPIAVDDIARPSAATSASRQSTPASTADAAISSAEPNNCTLPQPKIGRRSAHSRRGSSSSPTRNSISTTPNSAKCRMSCGSRDQLQAPRADHDAGAQVADDRAEAEQARQRHRDHRGGEVDQAAGQPGGAVLHQRGFHRAVASARAFGRHVALDAVGSSSAISGQSG